MTVTKIVTETYRYCDNCGTSVNTGAYFVPCFDSDQVSGTHIQADLCSRCFGVLNSLLFKITGKGLLPAK